MPKAFNAWQWQIEAMPLLRNLYLVTIKWSVILGAICIYLFYRLEPDRYIMLSLRVAVLLCLFPIHIHVSFRFSAKGRVHYKIHGSGISIIRQSTTTMPWQEIEWYRLDTHSQFARIGILIFKSKRFRKPRQLYFDTGEVDKTKIQEIMLQKHVRLAQDNNGMLKL